MAIARECYTPEDKLTIKHGEKTMKCIKVIKQAKSYELGEIRRMDDLEAEVKVKTGYWAFCPKSEWKLATRKVKVNQIVNEQPTEELSIEEKKLKRKKNDKQK